MSQYVENDPPAAVEVAAAVVNMVKADVVVTVGSVV